MTEAMVVYVVVNIVVVDRIGEESHIHLLLATISRGLG